MDDFETRVFGLETDTLRKVSGSLSKIEVALSEWNAAKKKPKKLEKRVQYLTMSHLLLSGWARSSLNGNRDIGSTLARLESFVEICGKLDKAREKLYGRKNA